MDEKHPEISRSIKPITFLFLPLIKFDVKEEKYESLKELNQVIHECSRIVKNIKIGFKRPKFQNRVITLPTHSSEKLEIISSQLTNFMVNSRGISEIAIGSDNSYFDLPFACVKENEFHQSMEKIIKPLLADIRIQCEYIESIDLIAVENFVIVNTFVL